jgi:ElaB/YqjD/DUF883 family membrane-anchored ribosome-binding protein
MSQNFNNTSNPTGSGGAGTGATDAGTTRDTTLSGSTGAGSTGGSTGSTGGSTGSGSTGLTTGGGAGSTGSGGTATGTATAREGIAGTAQEYGQKIAEAATTAKDYLGDKLSVAKDKFGDLQNVDYRQVADDAKQYARQNPGQALMISAAAGFLLGLLLRNSRR